MPIQSLGLQIPDISLIISTSISKPWTFRNGSTWLLATIAMLFAINVGCWRKTWWMPQVQPMKGFGTPLTRFWENVSKQDLLVPEIENKFGWWFKPTLEYQSMNQPRISRSRRRSTGLKTTNQICFSIFLWGWTLKKNWLQFAPSYIKTIQALYVNFRNFAQLCWNGVRCIAWIWEQLCGFAAVQWDAFWMIMISGAPRGSNREPKAGLCLWTVQKMDQKKQSPVPCLDQCFIFFYNV